MATIKHAPICLIIMDGWGIGDVTDKYNAIQVGNTPVLDELMEKYPNSRLQASGEYVGLPDGQMGNSEVGHMNIGAGRIIYQPLTKITKAIRDGEFFTNPALVGVTDKVVASGGALHLFGLLRKIQRNWHWADRDNFRTLLRNGPRQTLGQSSKSLRRHRER